MAGSALAGETLFALRREIARIEGHPAQSMEMPAGRSPEAGAGAGVLLRRRGVLAPGLLPTGIERFDRALGGGIPLDGLVEIHSAASREAASAAGFALAVAGMAMRRNASGPVLWIGTSEIFHEAGMPYLPGVASRFGIAAGSLLLSVLPRPEDVLRAAEEAARVAAFPAMIVELRGTPRVLDLTATRRLQHRAHELGHPLFLLRHGAEATPTAARLRLLLSPARAAPRRTLAGAVEDSIGDPVFRIDLDRSPTALTGQFLMEWNCHDLAFRERRPQSAVPLVSLPGHGTDLAQPAGTVVAFDPATALAGQPSGPQRPAHLRTRRSG